MQRADLLDADAGKDRGQEEKRATESEMLKQHHRLSRQESEQTPGDSEGQGSLRAAVHGLTESQAWLSGRFWVMWKLMLSCSRKSHWLHKRITGF